MHFEVTCTPLFASLNGKTNTHIGTMTEWQDCTCEKKKDAIIRSIDQSQAVIEFTPDGIIKHANDNFIKGMGYALSEIVNQHHSMFMPEEMKNSNEYKSFWSRLKKGEFFSAQVKRVAKGKRDIWLQASYNPLFDSNGNVTSVIKFASDITAQKVLINDCLGQIDAIHKSQAVIEFNLDGTIQTANAAFLATTGYTLPELIGKHHRIFVTPQYAQTAEYSNLWKRLNQGDFISDEIERVAKNGNTLWLQASYNPIFDTAGKPYKVVKYATNITARKNTIVAIQDTILKLTEGDLR